MVSPINNYTEGSEEWYAWGHGNDYAIATGGQYEYPLSHEWADMPTIDDVLNSVSAAMGYGSEWRDVYGDDEPGVILDAYEAGYRAYRIANNLETEGN